MSLYNKVISFGKSKLAKNSLIYVFGALFLKGISFFLIPIYTANFTPLQYGVMEMLNTLITLIAILLSFGFSQVIYMQFIHLNRKLGISLINDLNSIYITFSVPIFLFLPFLLPLFLDSSLTYLDRLKLSSIAVLISFFTFFLNTIYTVFQMLELSKLLTVNKIIVGVITIIINLILIKGFQIGIISVFIANFISLMFALIFVGSRKDFKVYFQKMKLFRISPKYLLYLRMGFPFVLTSLSYFALAGVDKIIISSILGGEALGIYSLAFKFSSVFEPLIITPILSAYTPYIFQRFAQGEKRQKNLLIILIVMGMAAILALIIPFGAKFMIDKQFHDSLRYIPYLSIGYGFIFLAQIFATYILFAKKVKILLKNVIVSGVLNVILNVVLTKTFGLEGACLAFLLSNFLWFVLTLIQSQKLKIKQNLII